MPPKRTDNFLRPKFFQEKDSFSGSPEFSFFSSCKLHLSKILREVKCGNLILKRLCYIISYCIKALQQ